MTSVILTNFKNKDEMHLFFVLLKIVILKLLISFVCANIRLSYKVVGGKNANKKQWAFIAAICCGKVVHCGGSLIRPRWILTAAHCVQGDNIDQHKEYFGDLNVQIGPGNLQYVDITEVWLPEKPPEITAQVSTVAIQKINCIEKVIVHEKFFMSKTQSEQTFMDVVSNDVALIKLLNEELDVPYISLPTKSVHLAKYCMTAGWGSKSHQEDITGVENELQQLSLKVLKPDICKKLLKGVAVHASASQKDISNLILNKFCCQTGYLNETIHSGDSGCPLICDGELQGIANLVVEQFSLEPSGVNISWSIFMEVPHYTDWINSVLRKNNDKLPDGLYLAKSSASITSITPVVLCCIVNILISQYRL